MRLARLLVVALLVGGLAWLALRPDRAVRPGDDRLVQREFLALGTLVSITVYLKPGQPRGPAEEAVGRAQRWLQDFERRWSAWGNGELGAINRDLAAGLAAEVAPSMHALFNLAEDQRRRSRGLFEPRIGQLVHLWGFAGLDERPPRVPSPEDVRRATEAIAAAPSWDPGVGRYGPAPGIAWDFGAIGKGYAVDEVIGLLRSAGIENAIVNAGGNLRAMGRRGERPWRVGIRHPRARAPDQVVAALDVHGDEAVVTSGDYERYFEVDGRRYHHILNPRSGHPARGLQSVTVVLPRTALADAASTALFVAGPEHWRDVSIMLNVSQLLLIDAQGQAIVSRALARRLQFGKDVKYRVVE